MLAVLHMIIIIKNKIVLGEDFIQGLTTTGTGYTIYAEKISAENLCLSLHCNGNNSYLFVNGVKELQFKAQ